MRSFIDKNSEPMRYRPWITCSGLLVALTLYCAEVRATEILTVSGPILHVYAGKSSAIPFPLAVPSGGSYTATFDLENAPDSSESQVNGEDGAYWTVTYANLDVGGQSFGYVPVTGNTGTLLDRGDVSIRVGATDTGLPYPIDEWQLDTASSTPLAVDPQGNFTLEFALFAPAGTISSPNYFFPDQSTWPTLPNVNDVLSFGACALSCNSFGGPVTTWSFQPVPEPSSAWLLLAGLAGLGIKSKSRRDRFGRQAPRLS